MKQQARQRPTLESLADGVLNGDRILLAQAITLIESHRPDDEATAIALLEKVMPHTGNSLRIGITGTPGVGKSTFIESLGQFILKNNKKVAVLSIDPTSPVGGGSILGDKTRMETLSKNRNAFIRPTASLDSLGGVAQRTRESMLLAEAAGYDFIIIETVGVGQSEYSVKEMVDFFLLLMLPGSGDDLQGMKKGIVELADAIAITKADGDNVNRARQAQAMYAQAIHTVYTGATNTPPVILTSAVSGVGIEEVWTAISDAVARTKLSGAFDQQRNRQYVAWLNDQFAALLKSDVWQYDQVRTAQSLLESEVTSKTKSPRKAANELLAAYHRQIKGS
ncbi:methylmalonyl Co-A mutase-associated GTPase MeaB [Chryseolinea sp. T2]|uniref:methylmalonyl Co-A mutase-associated GTPase MeaB n=1 Tax=Chryseolinea sp. T2 TaxID=3129255 RepID=UPI003077A0B9